MKPEDLEQRMAQQACRPVPEAWRTEILAVAAAARRQARTDSGVRWWLALRECLWPNPKAWAGLAAAWALIAAMNLASHGVYPPTGAQAKTHGVVDVRAMAEQRRMRAELYGESSPEENPQRPHPSLSPRSARPPSGLAG